MSERGGSSRERGSENGAGNHCATSKGELRMEKRENGKTILYIHGKIHSAHSERKKEETDEGKGVWDTEERTQGVRAKGGGGRKVLIAP